MQPNRWGPPLPNSFTGLPSSGVSYTSSHRSVGIGGAARPVGFGVGMESPEFCVVGWVYRWDGEEGRGPRKKASGVG
jgi:hypothetical protein